MASSFRRKYDVFLSFRGEDTRENITSHLYAALCRRKIETYIDYRLERGDEISKALLKAIRESKISVIIFSENYASSSWCLDELVEILKCRKNHKQIVIPIFYRIDPSSVRKQEGTYASAFRKLEGRFRDNILKRWKAALTEAANLSGWDSQKIRPESELVEAVVKDILKKLNNRSSSDSKGNLKGIVGIEKPINEVESLLQVGSPDVRVVGIWGMGGIGKTTLASAIFNKIASQFESCCFLVNVREESEKYGLNQLRNKFLSLLLEEEDLFKDSLHVRSTFLKDRLQRKKVFIVLDDVNDTSHLELITRENYLFGPGSRILLTSRNMHLLRSEAGEIYEVEALNEEEALQLFSLHAFKRYSPLVDYTNLAKVVVEYAKGIPLALKVLGCLLYDRSLKEWESALNKLKKFPNMEVQKMLKISYDELDDEEKNIFLDIACFFNWVDKDVVERILDGFDYSAAIGIRVLSDKSLITIESNKIQMHDLVQEMGWEIVRQQSIKELGNRSRLWVTEDVCHVLKRNTGTSAVEGLILDVSKIIRELQMSPTVFSTMQYMRYLKIYNCGSVEKCKLYLPSGLQSLPDALRYLHWDNYPLKSLPPNIPENLVELELPNGQLEQLWDGIQYLGKLKRLDLSHCKRLIQIPDLSEAQNLECINLECCTRLLQSPSYDFRNHYKLTFLNLGFCEDLMYLKEKPLRSNNKNLQCSNLKNLLPEISGNIEYSFDESTLKDLSYLDGYLDKQAELEFRNEYASFSKKPNNIMCKRKFQHFFLSHVSSFNKFPEVARNIRELYLSGTAIEQVPPWIEYLSFLEILDLSNCRMLKSLPTTIYKLKSLYRLSLYGCSKFENFPAILEPMDQLGILFLNGTAIRKLPSPIENIIGLRRLGLTMCENLDFLPSSIYKLSGIHELNLSGCSKLGKFPPLSFNYKGWIGMLNLCDCNISEIPESIGSLSSIQYLDLSGNFFESIPPSIKKLSRLFEIHMNNCKNLKSLPEFPLSLRKLHVHNCTLLETVSSSKAELTQGWDPYESYKLEFFYTNCPRLDYNASTNIMADAQHRIWSAATKFEENNRERTTVTIYYPGDEIPKWFSYQTQGSSLRIKLVPDWCNTNFLGFALCAVLASKDCVEDCFMLLQCKIDFETISGSHNHIHYFSDPLNMDKTKIKANLNHVLLWYDSWLCRRVKEKGTNYWCDNVTEASFNIYSAHVMTKTGDNCCKIEKLGIHLLYSQDAVKLDANDNNQEVPELLLKFGGFLKLMLLSENHDDFGEVQVEEDNYEVEKRRKGRKIRRRLLFLPLSRKKKMKSNSFL